MRKPQPCRSMTDGPRLCSSSMTVFGTMQRIDSPASASEEARVIDFILHQASNLVIHPRHPFRWTDDVGPRLM